MMRAEELVSLLMCQKKYDIEQLAICNTNQKQSAYSEALVELSRNIGNDKVEPLMRSHLDDCYKMEWFELIWQKEAAVRDDLLKFMRIEHWIRENFQGKIETQKNFTFSFDGVCHEKKITEVTIKADLLVEQRDGSLAGIILCRKFPKPYSYHARRLENMVCYCVELLCLLEALGMEYPDREIKVYMVSSISKKDKPDSVAIFEEKRGDNVIELTTKMLEEQTGKSCRDALRYIMKETQIENCQKCLYQDICQPATKIFVKPLSVKIEKSKEEIYYTLNQQKVIQHDKGPLRITAGPGSGKTATIVARIQHLIDCGNQPEKILAVAFTKKAAREILERIDCETKPYVCTLHSLGFQIIKQNEFLIGKKRLVSRVDCLSILMKTLNYAPVIRNMNYDVLTGEFGLLNNLLKDFEFVNKQGDSKFRKAYPNKDIKGIYTVKMLYEDQLQRDGFILYEDQIEMAADLLENYSGVRERYCEKYQYILVDEVQDLDEQQVRLIQLIVKQPENNIVICGDANQSIYSFRGGSSQFMLNFIDIYPEAMEIQLNTNFRSSQKILDIANSLIRHNVNRIPIEMKSATKSSGLEVIQYANFRINKFGTFIQDMLDNGYRQEDIAIIAMANKDLSCICDTLDKYNQQQNKNAEYVRYDRPKYYVYQDFTFQTILDLLDLFINRMQSDKALYRILTSMGIKPEKKDRESSLYDNYLKYSNILPMWGEEETCNLAVTNQDAPIKQAFAKIYKAFKLFGLPLENAIIEISKQFFDECVDNEEIIKFILKLINEKSVDSPVELFQHMYIIKKFQDDTRVTYSSRERNRVHLLTAHDAKGKEFPVVLVYGVDNFERENPQEDRRLLYVALTRAKEMLMLTEICKGKSGFIKEIEKHMTIMGGMRYA